MNWYERIKKYYDQKLWTKQQVKNVIGKVISEEEYKKIISEKI